MTIPSAPTSADVRHVPAIATLRARIAEQSAHLLRDLERLHEVIDGTRPIVHTAEAFEVLEEMDTQTFEALHTLANVLERLGLRTGSSRATQA